MLLLKQSYFNYIIFTTICSSLFVSCKHKANFNLIPSVSYTTEIAPIISKNCTYSGCHGDTLAFDFKMRNYSELITGGEIKAGNPQQSKLYQVLRGLNKNEIMPKKPYLPLTENEIQIIYVWIGQGAKNN